jgi:hypothetical protein
MRSFFCYFLSFDFFDSFRSYLQVACSWISSSFRGEVPISDVIDSTAPLHNWLNLGHLQTDKNRRDLKYYIDISLSS